MEKPSLYVSWEVVGAVSRPADDERCATFYFGASRHRAHEPPSFVGTAYHDRLYGIASASGSPFSCSQTVETGQSDRIQAKRHVFELAIFLGNLIVRIVALAGRGSIGTERAKQPSQSVPSLTIL